jgi:hypothetical protein
MAKSYSQRSLVAKVTDSSNMRARSSSAQCCIRSHLITPSSTGRLTTTATTISA